jgi:sugar/nucleoside kinase (ribokinase family)
MELDAALRLATAAAGLSVTKYGGRPATPELSEVLKVLSDE